MFVLNNWYHPKRQELLSQVMNCIACLEDLGSMGNGLLIYMMAQHLVAKP